MYAKKIKFVDFNGEEREETFYFNLMKSEVMEMQLEVKGGLTTIIQKIIETKDVPELVKIFKDLIHRSYGEKSPDGKRFIKSKELSDAFSQTEAYSNLFMELSTDADAASAFINGIVPPEYRPEEKKKQLDNKN